MALTRPSSRTQSPFETYLGEINEMPLLSAKEEHELALAIKGGDRSAAERMARSNLRLVVSIARAYIGRGLDVADLVEEGNLGLLRAVDGFSPHAGTRFSTYASYWIKQSIRRAIIDTAKTIRVPAYVIDLQSKWNRVSRDLLKKNGTSPSNEEIADALKIPRRRLKKLLRYMDEARKKSAAADGDGELALTQDAEDPTGSPADLAMQQELLEKVARGLGMLDEQAATIIRMRFGLDTGGKTATLKEIGQFLHLSHECVRQIEKKALGTLLDYVETAQPAPVADDTRETVKV